MTTTPKRPSTRSGIEKDPRRRIHKILSAAGVCSLREAERLIAEGRVTVNGKAVTEKGASADPEKDVIRVDGRIVKTSVPPVYIALNKPKGYVTTRSDERGRRTVMELLPKEFSGLFPVGRLDLMSEGLLLFTNDGAFAQAVMSPKNRIKRVYKVKVRNVPDAKAMAKMTSGLTVKGEKLKFAAVERTSRTATNAWLKVTLTEGKKRHIRRLLETLGHPVTKLKRVSIGPVTLGDLKPGEARHVKKELVNRIMKSAGKK